MLSQLSHVNCVASHHIISHRLSWRSASHQRIFVALLEGCREKIECKTSTVCHELSTEDHLVQKVVCSTSTRSEVARTEGRIARAAPSRVQEQVSRAQRLLSRYGGRRSEGCKPRSTIASRLTLSVLLKRRGFNNFKTTSWIKPFYPRPSLKIGGGKKKIATRNK
jgi:hypothetical protein